jgi:hypothetical protein
VSSIGEELKDLWNSRKYFAIAALLFLIGKGWEALTRAFIKQDELGELSRFFFEIANGIMGKAADLALIIFFVGIGYWIFTEVLDFVWGERLQKQIDNGFKLIAESVTLGSSTVSNSYVARWIKNSAEEPHVYKTLAYNSLCKCYGAHCEQDDSYLKFVMDNLVDTHSSSGNVTRHNYMINIVIGKSDQYPKFLKWIESKEFVLRCPAGRGSTELVSIINSRADKNDLNDLLSLLKFTITLDNKPAFSLQQWLQEAGTIDSSKDFIISNGDAQLSFDGKWMYFSFKRHIDFDKEVRVKMVEESFMSKDERSYTFIVRQPTFNISLTMRLEGLNDWQLQKPNVGSTWYHSESGEFANIDQIHAQWVTATVPRWVLPGVWATAEWASEGTG